MLDRLDDLLKRFSAFFLVPLVNIAGIGLIFYICTKADVGSAFSGDNIKGFVATVLGFMSGLFESSLASALAFAEKYSHQIQIVSFFILGSLFVIFVVLMYVFDRLTYYAGFLLPPAFDFDIRAYAHLRRTDERLVQLDKTLRKAAAAPAGAAPAGEDAAIRDLALPAVYGMLRAYLGERNRDPYRIAFRSGLSKSIASIKTVSCYVKAYLLIAALLAAFSFMATGFSFWRAIGVIAVLLAILLLLISYYGKLFRQLVEYDIDSFIWDRCYNAHRAIDVSSLVPGAAGDPGTFGGLRRAAAERFLKIFWFEVLK